MKTMTLFELGFLDLIKVMFFGKKIRVVLDKHAATRKAASAPAGVTRTTEATDEFAKGSGGYNETTNPDPSWHPGKFWLDPYHTDPLSDDPFDRW